LAWSDPTLQELIKRFVPCADEVGHLQRADTPAAKLFQVFCERGHYRFEKGGSGTRQGTYAVTPSGKLLRSWNTRGVEAVAREMTAALKTWDALDDRERVSKETLPAGGRAEDSYPEDGLALLVYTRDLPRENDVRPEDWRERAWNLDHLWLSAEEVRALVDGALPEGAARRLVRIHGRDNVRGQTFHFSNESVTKASLEVSARLHDGAVQFLTLTGLGSASQTGEWSIGGRRGKLTKQTRTFSGTMYGKAVWNGARFTEFELAWTGIRSGASKYNQRADDQGPAPMAVVFRLAPPDDRVAPSRFWAYGWR